MLRRQKHVLSQSTTPFACTPNTFPRWHRGGGIPPIFACFHVVSREYCRDTLPAGLVAHRCCDPCRAIQCRAQSVAANSRSLRDVAGVSRYTPPTLTKRPCRTYLATPLSVSHGNFFAKTDRATRGCSSYTHTNRAALCH